VVTNYSSQVLMLSSSADSLVSELDSSSESLLGTEVVKLRVDLETEKRQNKHLVAKLQRATKLNESLVRPTRAGGARSSSSRAPGRL